MGAEKRKADVLPATLDVLKMLMRGHLHGSNDLLRVEERLSLRGFFQRLRAFRVRRWIAYLFVSPRARENRDFPLHFCKRSCILL
jgi:hypothetical protein